MNNNRIQNKSQNRRGKRNNRINKSNKIVIRGRTQGETGALAYAKRALKMAEYIRSIINVEYKYYEADQSFVANYNGTLTNICSPTQGVSVIQRDGDSIKMKTCQVTGQISGGTALPEVVRIIVFIDKEGLIAGTGSNLLENTASASVVRASLNQDNRNDVNILIDESFAMDTYHPISIFNFVIPVETHQHFLAGSANVKNNGLTLGVFSQGATLSPTVSYHTHTTYVDN